MRVAGETIGGRGTALLAVTAVVGIALGAHGWSGRNSGLPPSGTGLGGSRPTSAASPASPAGPQPTAGPTQGPTAAPTPTPGPKLSSQSYASYAFQVWPGSLSAAAKAAETGLSVSVRRQGTGISVTAGVVGQALPAPRYYPTGARVYVIEASMGDESGNSDYNLGDDGLIVTDAQGRILQ